MHDEGSALGQESSSLKRARAQGRSIAKEVPGGRRFDGLNVEAPKSFRRAAHLRSAAKKAGHDIDILGFKKKEAYSLAQHVPGVLRASTSKHLFKQNA